jgi:uncharacterized protein YjbI with pentapeptide repeats
VIEIKRYDEVVVYTSDATTIAHALTDAVRAGVDLNSVDLADANLAGANLAGAKLIRSDLIRADLTGANLTRAGLLDATLVDANLTRASLIRANLSGANLARADLTDANLTGASLTRAWLRNAILREADLLGTDLSRIRNDVWAILDAAPAEVPTLLSVLRAGRFDGSVYQGDCACLVGTIANARGCHYENMAHLGPDGDRAAERWAIAIRPGDTPDNHPVAAITATWIEEWTALRLASFRCTS